MEAFFCPGAKLFLPPRREAHGARQHMEKAKDGLRPGIPQRTQQRRKKQKGAACAGECRKEGIHRQSAPIHPQNEKESAKPCRKAVQRVKPRRRPSHAVPQSAQQIIEQGKRRAEGKGDEQRTELRRIVNAHAYPPKSRRSSPRSAGALS